MGDAFNFPGVKHLLESVLALAILCIGIGIIFKANKSSWSRVISTVGIAIVGILFAGIGIAWYFWGEQIGPSLINR